MLERPNSNTSKRARISDTFRSVGTRMLKSSSAVYFALCVSFCLIQPSISFGRMITAQRQKEIAAEVAKAKRKEMNEQGKTSEENISKIIIVAVVGAVSYSCYKKAQYDDEQELKRITEEVERLNKWQNEFIDIDEGVTSDEDFSASLAKRIGKDGSADTMDGSSTDSAPSETEGGGERAASAEDIERLKRMFNDDDSKDSN